MAINQQKDLPAAATTGDEPGPDHQDQDRDRDQDPRRLNRFRETVRRNALLNTTWRIGVFTVGTTVLIGGSIMMVTPGPGLLGIIVGLAILGTEFAWARRALNRARKAAEAAKEKALDPRTKRRNTILAVIGGILVGALVIAYLVVYDFTLPWAIADWTPWLH